MSYAVHITRATTWPASAQTPITLAEWRSVIDADPTLEPDDDDTAAASWNGHLEPEDRPEFFWVGGRIVIQRPDVHAVGKAVELARVLRARVIGDDGEVYD
jgi:hypothetical protein